jgi:FKBP-type peptidyl-prolyl cis-trans isomerase FklB
MRLVFLPAAAAVCLTLTAVGFSQDELPPAGTAGGELRQQGAPGQAPGAPGANDAEYQQQVSYALGRNFAQNLRELDVQLDMNALMAGITDVMQDQQPKWTDEQLGPTMQRFSMEMQQKAMTRMKNLAAKNEQEAKAFLAQNAKREGIETTPSGLQYRVVRAAEGASPTMGDTVKCNYKGTLLNGTEFDNSQQHGGPAEFRVGPPLIEGWIEALQKMKVGEKWQLFVPPGLAYKANPPGPPIEPNSMLVFEIELLDIVPQQ